MRKTLGSLKRSRKTLRTEQNISRQATFLGVLFYLVGGNSMKRRDNIYELTDQLHKNLSSTGLTGDGMKKILMFKCSTMLKLI